VRSTQESTSHRRGATCLPERPKPNNLVSHLNEYRPVQLKDFATGQPRTMRKGAETRFRTGLSDLDDILIHPGAGSQGLASLTPPDKVVAF
jgi:hypothetical protein